MEQHSKHFFELFSFIKQTFILYISFIIIRSEFVKLFYSERLSTAVLYQWTWPAWSVLKKREVSLIDLEFVGGSGWHSNSKCSLCCSAVYCSCNLVSKKKSQKIRSFGPIIWQRKMYLYFLLCFLSLRFSYPCIINLCPIYCECLSSLSLSLSLRAGIWIHRAISYKP